MSPDTGTRELADGRPAYRLVRSEDIELSGALPGRSGGLTTCRLVDGTLGSTHMALTLWGQKGAHPTLAKPFATLPTSCQPATTTIDVRAYDGAGSGGSGTFTPTDCAGVPFTPSLVVGPKQTEPDTPGEATATLQVPAPVGDNRVQANVRRVELKLPADHVLVVDKAAGIVAGPVLAALGGPYPVQSLGDRGTDVAALQELLRHHVRQGGTSGTGIRGVSGGERSLSTIEVRGIYGAMTVAAVKGFQSTHGLPVTGIALETTWMTIVPTLGRLPARSVVVTGLGDREGNGGTQVMRAAGSAARRLGDRSTVASTLHLESDDSAPSAETEGFVLGSYRFVEYKSDPHPSTLQRVLLLAGPDTRSIERGLATADATWLARDLTNEPASTLYPETFAARAREIADVVEDQAGANDHGRVAE